VGIKESLGIRVVIVYHNQCFRKHQR
jgi:hypothetical protein